MHIFVKTNLELVSNAFCMKKKKHFAEKKKVIVCSKGLNRAHLNTIKKKIPKMFLIFSSIFMENEFDTNSRFFHKKMHLIKKKKIIDSKVLLMTQVFTNVGGNALFWRGH